MEREAVYFDGLRPVARRAALALTGRGLNLSIDDGPSFLWDYASIRLSEESDPVSRFHREQSGTHTGESLEITDAEFTAALKARCPSLGGTRRERQRITAKIVGWSAAAIVSAVLLVLYGVPALAARIAPLVPWSTEVSLGNAVEGQIMQQLPGGPARLCGTDKSGEGHKALLALTERLVRHADLPGAVDVKVADSGVQNAFTLPGGKIIFMRGLIEKATSPDEVAGVLAHELGHVAHRDAMRSIIHSGGISFLIGTLLGDFTGAGALVIGSKFLLGTRYSRENESEADEFAIEVMSKAGGDVRALAGFLRRVAQQPGERQLELLLTHPVTEDRVAAIERRAPSGQRQPLMSDAEWQALKQICRLG